MNMASRTDYDDDDDKEDDQYNDYHDDHDDNDDDQAFNTEARQSCARLHATKLLSLLYPKLIHI